MSILPIYLYDQSVLRKKAKPIRTVGDDIVRVAADMMETMHQAGGIGLAANQVGLLQRMIVVDVSASEEEAREPRPYVMLNPEVVEEAGKWVMEEGCLSIPELREEVERSENIRVKYLDLKNREQVLEADGLLARVILHEIDHLNGVLFIDHLNAVKRKLLRGRLNKIRKGEIEVTYPVVTANGGSVSHHHIEAHASAKSGE